MPNENETGVSREDAQESPKRLSSAICQVDPIIRTAVRLK